MRTMVAVHDVQNVHQLALVRVNALDLNVEHRIRSDLYPVVLLDVTGKALAAQVLDLHQLFEEVLVLNARIQSVHLLRMAMPLTAAQHLVNQCRKLGVRPHQPAAMCNAVGLVVELARRVVIEIFERCRLQDARVDCLLYTSDAADD